MLLNIAKVSLCSCVGKSINGSSLSIMMCPAQYVDLYEFICVSDEKRNLKFDCNM